MFIGEMRGASAASFQRVKARKSASAKQSHDFFSDEPKSGLFSASPASVAASLQKVKPNATIPGEFQLFEAPAFYPAEARSIRTGKGGGGKNLPRVERSGMRL